ncbi:MAG: HNH endonuclease [Anaeromyxobacteraceae bacterium]
MHATSPASLDSAALALRLAELAGDEREILVEFLVHLEEFDRRRAYLDAGHDSLWAYCQRALLLREGPTALRIAAMRLLRRFPVIADLLRDGRLCLSTLKRLEPVLEDDNAADLLAQAAGKSKLEVERLVVALQRRPAPRDGLRRIPVRAEAAPSLAVAPPGLQLAQALFAPAALDVVPEPSPAPPPRRAKVTPVAKDRTTLTVTVSDEFLETLDDVKALLSHKVPDGNLADVLLEALRCAREKHGKRRGAVEPERKVPARPAPAPRRDKPQGREAIPVAVKRNVFKRDGGRCTYVAPDGTRCDSRRRLEYHHVHEAALGGPSTEENITVRCRAHNVRAAEVTFGVEFMSQFRRRDTPRAGELIEPGISAVDARQASLFATD